MDDIFAFIGGLYLGIHYTRTKKIEYVFKIQWKEQPVLFGIIILLFWFFALDSFLRHPRPIRTLSHFREAAATPGHHHILRNILCRNHREHFHEASRDKEKDLHLARQAPNQKFDSGHLSPPDKHFCERTAGILRNFIIK